MAKTQESATPDDVRARRAAAGREAKEAGKAFEKARDIDLLTLEQRGFIHVWWPNNPGWRRVGPRWLPVEASGADRAGTLANGKSFAMELKSTSAEKDGRAGRFDRSRISMKQEAHLEKTARKAASLLCLEFRRSEENVLVLVPWRQVPWHGRRSIRLEDVAAYAIPYEKFGDCFIAYCEEMTR